MFGRDHDHQECKEYRDDEAQLAIIEIDELSSVDNDNLTRENKSQEMRSLVPFRPPKLRKNKTLVVDKQ